MTRKGGAVLNPSHTANEWGLTPGEMEILHSIVSGATDEEIAHRHCVTLKTARSYTSRIAVILLDTYRCSREQLIAYARANIFKEEV